ncbi:MAG: hypothetical protein J5836_02690 [Clostridia bacterium]|nr:hypothetical protein [Clostridia bacterium]
MFEVTYTEEQLKKCGLNFLRNYAREIGGTPGLMNKADLVAYILDIQSGKISPERKKSGRKPLDLKGVNYGMLGLANIGFEDEDVFSDSYGSECITKGYFETLSEGVGTLTNGETVLVFVPAAFITQYRLKNCDLVVGEWERGRNDSRVLTSVKEINGKIPTEVFSRGNFEKVPAVYPESRISFSGIGGLGNEIDLFAPIGRGQRCVVLYKKGSDEISLIEKIAAVCDDSGIYPIISYVNCRPEDGQYLQSACKEVIWTSFDKSGETHKKAMQIVADRAKRMAESGNHTALIAGSLSSSQDAFGGDFLKYMKQLFSISKNTADSKSVTLFALTDDENVAKQFEPYCNCFIVTDGKSMDIERSYTRRDVALLSERELLVAEKVRSAPTLLPQVKSAMGKAKGKEELLSALEKLF